MSSHAATYIDASLFMGMHNPREAVRIACKNFLVERMGIRLSMTLDQIGLCDDIIWRQPRHIQDLYYPFMDQLHTLLAAERVPFTPQDIRTACQDPRVNKLDGPRALLMARICNHGARLYTIDPVLLERMDLPVCLVRLSPEKDFQEPIERAYRASLALRIEIGELLERDRNLCCVG